MYNNSTALNSFLVMVTNEESGNENEATILHLPSRMLRSQVELQKRPSFLEKMTWKNEKSTCHHRRKKKGDTIKNGMEMSQILLLLVVVKENVMKKFLLTLKR
ncbi:hypothetical protein EVAR_79994_1 [Eumeta japonica]|uniref:Uncharacterized protein n=1 Tax=Eumeta variegata TaxID=151549 RepID=A0A4C1ZTY6_EUMVA|nr:hypothetical protein EVAR_79994_1 [Eumeta japonica]